MACVWTGWHTTLWITKPILQPSGSAVANVATLYATLYATAKFASFPVVATISANGDFLFTATSFTVAPVTIDTPVTIDPATSISTTLLAVLFVRPHQRQFTF